MGGVPLSSRLMCRQGPARAGRSGTLESIETLEANGSIMTLGVPKRRMPLGALQSESEDQRVEVGLPKWVKGGARVDEGHARPELPENRFWAKRQHHEMF